MIDLEQRAARYRQGCGPEGRYASFDYCFNYFQSFRDGGRIASLADPEHRQVSCLQLGFYLASWGMLRGSSDLLRRSARYLVPVIEAIALAPPAVWETDAHRYDDANIDRLLSQARAIRTSMPGAKRGASDTLVTKIMIGVFGNVPAFDTRFTRAFGAQTEHRPTLCPETLKRIGAFYHDQSAVIERCRVPTLDFVSGRPTGRLYTRAKVIDMVFFVDGDG